MREWLRKITQTEPVRLGEVLVTLLTAVAMFVDFIDLEAGLAIIASVIAVYEVVRSRVWSPASVEALQNGN